MDYEKIEQAAIDLQLRVWRSRIALSIDVGPVVRMLDPAIGAAVHNIEFELHPTLGTFGFKGTRFEVAGLLDRRNNKIQISEYFNSTTQRFTAAHELGHFLLHKHEVMHRDRPIYGSTPTDEKRSPFEREADFFAACYLMPRKHLLKQFEARFGSRKPFEFNESAAFNLCPNDVERVFESDLYDRAAMLATATRFSGRPFRKLCDEFLVSHSAMAIRLIELELVV